MIDPAGGAGAEFAGDGERRYEDVAFGFEVQVESTEEGSGVGWRGSRQRSVGKLGFRCGWLGGPLSEFLVPCELLLELSVQPLVSSRRIPRIKLKDKRKYCSFVKMCVKAWQAKLPPRFCNSTCLYS